MPNLTISEYDTEVLIQVCAYMLRYVEYDERVAELCRPVIDNLGFSLPSGQLCLGHHHTFMGQHGMG